MSGLLGQILGALGNQPGAQTEGQAAVPTGAQAGALSGMVGELLGSAGGLSGLVATLTKSGLGDQVKSWVGTGANQPISPEQLAPALPPERVQAWSQQLGLDQNAVLAALAHVLPHAVDQATPDGAVPPGGTPAPGFDVAGIVGKLLGGGARTA